MDQTIKSSTLLWPNSEQGRIHFSSVGADILAAEDAADRSLHQSDCLVNILQSEDVFPIRLTLDSFVLYSSIPSLRECRDYVLRPIVALFRLLRRNEISLIQ